MNNLKGILGKTAVTLGLAGALASSGCLPLIAAAQVDNAMAQHRIANALEERNRLAAGGSRRNSDTCNLDYLEDQVFAYTSKNDDNCDGSISLNEFRERGETTFVAKQSVNFCLYRSRGAGDVRFVLKHESGKVIADVMNYAEKGGNVYSPGVRATNGEFTAEWSRNGAPIGKTTVTWK